MYIYVFLSYKYTRIAKLQKESKTKAFMIKDQLLLQCITNHCNEMNMIFSILQLSINRSRNQIICDRKGDIVHCKQIGNKRCPIYYVTKNITVPHHLCNACIFGITTPLFSLNK